MLITIVPVVVVVEASRVSIFKDSSYLCVLVVSVVVVVVVGKSSDICSISVRVVAVVVLVVWKSRYM